MSENRRRFFQAAATAAASGRVWGANDRIRIALLGSGGRGRYITGLALKTGRTELAAVCDVYEPRREQAQKELAPAAQLYVDYRQVLERGDIDAVIVGSPDHWHTPMTMDAVRAGKDVYVEKPVTHNIPEGDDLIKAVRSTRRVVQIGYQQRSWEHFIRGREIIAQGTLGKISLVLASWYQNYMARMNAPAIADESKLDWRRFQGNAPERPFEAVRFLRWRMFFDYGGGHLTDLYSHYGDVIHWYMAADTPNSVQAVGGRYFLTYGDCPDTITAAYDYPGFGVTYTGTLNGSLHGGTIIFRGSRALMRVTRDGLEVYPEGVLPAEKTHYPEPSIQLRSQADGSLAHVANWLDAIRARKDPNCPVEPAVASARAAHLGNLAYRRGAAVKWPG
jgi:predicted dehydrogenase